MRYENTSTPARKYHYWRGFITASIVLGVPLLVLSIECNTIITAIVK